LNLFIRMDLALLILVLVNILINSFEASDAENEVKVSIDNDEYRFTFSFIKRNPIADNCFYVGSSCQAPFLYFFQSSDFIPCNSIAGMVPVREWAPG
jgi:hypothetical protein